MADNRSSTMQAAGTAGLSTAAALPAEAAIDQRSGLAGPQESRMRLIWFSLLLMMLVWVVAKLQ
jgi:hypothetical protein